MQASPAIFVKRLCATSNLGVRYSAYIETHQNGKKFRTHIHTVSEEPEWEGDDGYWRAAIGLCVKAGLRGLLQGAYTVEGMVFVIRTGEHLRRVVARRERDTDETYMERVLALYEKV